MTRTTNTRLGQPVGSERRGAVLVDTPRRSLASIPSFGRWQTGRNTRGVLTLSLARPPKSADLLPSGAGAGHSRRSAPVSGGVPA